MNLYDPAQCERVRRAWAVAYGQFIASTARPDSQLCVISSAGMHLGRYRYILDTSFLRF